MINQSRTESLPNKDGTVFKVGEGCHWGFNGDSYPGTVLFVSNSGRRVWVSHDNITLTDKGKSQTYHEGPKDCDFETVQLPQDQCDEYYLNKWGVFVRAGDKKSGPNDTAWSLRSGRVYSQNPSF